MDDDKGTRRLVPQPALRKGLLRDGAQQRGFQTDHVDLGARFPECRPLFNSNT